MIRKSLTVTVLWVVFLFTLAEPINNNAQAFVSVGPFAGNYSESFESFPDYLHQINVYFPEGTSIMGGLALISSAHHDMLIYNPNSGAFSGLGTTLAGTVDGSQGLSVNSADNSVTIDFNTPVTAFGGYFAEDDYFFTPFLQFSFSDGSSDSYYYSDPNGALHWVGWEFDAGIDSVTISGCFFALDSLQATVPEPSSLVMCLFGGGVAMFVYRSRKQ